MIKSIVYTSILYFLTLAVVNIHAGNILSRTSFSDESLDYETDLTAIPKCPVDEEYNRCGSACPPSCSDLFFPQETKFCTKQCVRGCFCKTGLVRAKSGKCVKPSECCTGRNEIYTDCGTACPARCDFEPGACVDVCVEGCFCKDGFVRRDNRTNSPCIDPKRC